MPLYSDFANKLEEILSNRYDNLSFKEKCELVKNMLIVVDTGAGVYHYEGHYYGKIRKTLTPKKILFIDESCTGLYSERKEL